jgi:hypothetical protein
METRDERLARLIARMEAAIKKREAERKAELEAELQPLRTALESLRDMPQAMELLERIEAGQPLSPAPVAPQSPQPSGPSAEPEAQRPHEVHVGVTEDEDDRETLGKRLSLRRAMIEEIRSREGEFTVPEIAEAVVARYPERFNQGQKSSVSSIFSKLVKQGIAILVRPGSGSRPPVYKSREAAAKGDAKM